MTECWTSTQIELIQGGHSGVRHAQSNISIEVTDERTIQSSDIFRSYLIIKIYCIHKIEQRTIHPSMLSKH